MISQSKILDTTTHHPTKTKKNLSKKNLVKCQKFNIFENTPQISKNQHFLVLVFRKQFAAGNIFWYPAFQVIVLVWKQPAAGGIFLALQHKASIETRFLERDLNQECPPPLHTRNHYFNIPSQISKIQHF